MSDADKPVKKDWDKVDSIIRKQDASISPIGLANKRPMAAIEEYTANARKEKLDFIGRFKLGGIERKAALEKIQSMYDAQLEATKHSLKRALEVEKERVDLIAKKYIYEITEEYLRDMSAFGIQNYQARVETLFKLNEETARLLKTAQDQDIPERLREKTLDAILAKHEEFFKKLTTEEITLK
jgi:hypothetical protein